MEKLHKTTTIPIIFHYNKRTIKSKGEKTMKKQDLREELKSLIEEADFTPQELELLIEKAKQILGT